MVLEAFIGAEPRAARAAKLPAHASFLLDDVLDARSDKIVVLLLARLGRGIRHAFGGAQNFNLRLGDALPSLVHIGQRVVALGRAHVDQDPLGSVG